MSDAHVSPMPPYSPPKKSRATCLILAIVGVVLVGLLLIAVVAGVAIWYARSKPTAEATPTPIETPYPTPVGTATPEEAEDLPSPTSAETPVRPSSLDALLEDLANEPAFSASRADTTLRRDVLRTIITSLASSGCEVSAHGARVLSPADDDGVWTERWDLKICGKTRRLRIRFTPTIGGGTDYNVTE
jgi:hypothetical protein